MSPSTAKPRKLVVIDGANAIYRAFFAIPGLRAPDGTPTNAVLGFATMLAKILREESPDLIAVAFDPRGGSFRNRVFEGYKAGRDAQPEDLSSQIPLVREVMGVALGIVEGRTVENDLGAVRSGGRYLCERCLEGHHNVAGDACLRGREGNPLGVVPGAGSHNPRSPLARGQG